MSRCALAAALLVALAWPAPAAAKRGAFFNPQLLELPAGRTVRLQLWVGPEVRTRIAGAPVVLVRLPGRTVRFRGTPLDRLHRSRVAVRLPIATGGQRWSVAVRAGGRTYRDTIDGGTVDGFAGPPAWPFAATTSGRWWQARP